MEQVTADQIRVGDQIQVRTRDEVEFTARVSGIDPCDLGFDIYFEGRESILSCSGTSGRTWYRVASVPQGWEPVAPSDIRVGDYIQGVWYDNPNNVRQGEVIRIDPALSVRVQQEGAQPYSLDWENRVFYRLQATETWSPISYRQVQVGDYVRGTWGTDTGDVYEGTVARFTDNDEYVVIQRTGDTEVTASLESRNWERRGTPTSSPEPTWHEIPFGDLKPGDQVRVTFAGTSRTGIVSQIQGARATIKEQDTGREFAATALRKFEVGNRVPEPTKPLEERYPSIHHLKAALFDVAMANKRSGAWCGDVHDWVQELGIADNLYTDDGLLTQADQVKALVAKLQQETAGNRGVSQGSFDAARKALGLPEPVTHKLVTITVAIGENANEADLGRYIERWGQSSVESIEVQS